MSVDFLSLRLIGLAVLIFAVLLAGFSPLETLHIVGLKISNGSVQRNTSGKKTKNKCEHCKGD